MMKPDPRPEARGRPDMSPEAIDRRLCELAQLHRLGVSLRAGRWVGPVEARDRTTPES